MKKWLKMMFVCVLSFMLTGCMKMTITMNVNKKGEVTEDMKILMSKEMLTANGADLDAALESMKKEYVEKYPDAKIETVTEKFDDSEYAGLNVKGIKDEDLKATVEGRVVTLELPMNELTEDVSDMNDTGMDFSPSQLKSFGCSMKLVVNMPDKAECEYGTVDGKTVTIDLLEVPVGTKSIIITSKLGGFPWWLLIIPIAAVAVFFLKRKK